MDSLAPTLTPDPQGPSQSALTHYRMMQGPKPMFLMLTTGFRLVVVVVTIFMTMKTVLQGRIQVRLALESLLQLHVSGSVEYV